MSGHLVQQPGATSATASGRGQPKYSTAMSHGQHPGPQQHQGHVHRGNPATAPPAPPMRPPVNANFPHFSRGMPQSGDMKGGPVGAQGPHGGMPAGPPPPAPTGAPIGGFSPVSQIVAQGVQQIAMAQPGQPNPNQRPQVAYGQFFTSAARSQQGAGYATPSAPSGRPMQMIMPYPRQYFPPAGPYPFYSVTPQAGPQMLATTQSNTMMAPQPTYQAQQAPQRLIPREKKLIPIRNPDTMEEIQLNYVNKKATSGPPQSAISPAPASSVGGPAPVLMNPGGNMNVLPPQTSLVVNPIVPSQPAQPAQPQQQPPPQGQPPQLIPQQQPDSAAPPSIAPTVPQSQPQQQQQPPQAPLLQATPVPKPQPAAVPPPAAHAQQQAHPQQHASGGYSAAPATPSAASTAGINTTIVPQAGLNVPTKDTASTQPLGPPIPGSAVSQTTQVAPDRPAEKREATSDVAQASPASVSPVLSVEASGSTADQAEMESPEEAVNDSSEVSENAAAGDREPGSRSSLQREEDEERRKVEVKNEENLRKSQEAKGLSNNQQLPQIEQSILSEPGKDEPAVSTEHAEVPEAAKGDKVTTATVHKKSSEDAGSNEQGSTSGKKDEAAREDNDETNSRQDEEEGEESDESDVELDVDNKTEQSTDSNGKKKYDRDFLLRLQRQPMSMMPPKNMPNLEIFKNSAGNHTLADKPRGAPTGYVDQFAMRNGRGGAPGGSMNRNAKGAQARAGERPKKVITLSSSMSQDVKLHTAEKAWKPIKEPVSSDTDDALYKKFRGILNKLTPQRFDTLLDQVKKLDINSEERLSKVTQLVLEKALNETHFASTYARLCHTLLTVFNVPKITREPGPVNPSVSFRKMLLQKCQYEFETDTDDSAASKEREKKQQEERQGKLDAAKSEQERKEIQDQFNELDVKMKRRTFGLMRFIGELYNLDILNFNIMSDCFRKLMKNPTDEDSIVCACKLFTTVGKKLAEESMIRRGVNETPELKDKHTLFQSLMQNLRKIISENRDAQRTGQKCLPQRVIFMLEDVRDLKDRDWVPRRNEQAPQTLEQIQKDAETEKMLANLSNTGPPSGGGGSRFPPMQSDRNRRPFNSQSQSSTTLRGADFKQAIKNFPNNLSSMSFPVAPSLGPSGPQWVGGASGGGSRNSSLRGTRGEPPLVASANKYDALKGDGPDHPMRSQESSPSRQRERDAALQNVRKMNLGNAAGSSGVRPSGGRGSAPASRDASQGGGLGGSQPGAGSNTTHSLQGTEFEDEKIKRFAQTIISEYTTNGNSEDLVKDFCDRAHINNLNQFLKYFIELSIEAQPRQRTRAGEAIRELHDQRIVSHKHVESVIKEQLSIAEDMVIDIPKYYEYLAEIIAPLFISEGMNFTALLRAVKLVLVPADTTKMLVPLFKRIREISSEGISKKWQASGMNLSELVSGLREQDVKAIEAALGLSGQAATTNPGLPLQELCQRFQTALDTSSTASDLEQALRAVVHQAGNDQRKLTARAFATALLNIGLQLKEKGTTRQQDCTLNVKLLNEKLRLDIEGKGMPPSISQLFADEEVAIQALYALQVVMQENEHPKEATSNFINWLYDKDLLSEEVFKDWAKKDSKKHEPMGYHMTVQHAQGFLTWLSEG